MDEVETLSFNVVGNEAVFSDLEARIGRELRKRPDIDIGRHDLAVRSNDSQQP